MSRILPLLLFALVSCSTISEYLNDPSPSSSSQSKVINNKSGSSSASNATLDRTKQQLLFRYIKEGNLDGVKKAESLGADLRYGMSLDEPNGALMKAIEKYYDDIYTMQRLGSDYADPSKTKPIIEYLKDKSPNLNIMWSDGRSVGLSFCKNSLRACQTGIGEWGIDPNSSTAWAYMRHMVSSDKWDAIMPYLLDQGLDASKGSNPLENFLAMSPELLENLLEHGASDRVNTYLLKSDRYFPLYYSVSRHDIRKTRILLTHGADPNQNCGKPLSEAVFEQNVEIVKLLLANGADPNLTCDNGYGTTILKRALKGKKTAIVDLLLEYNAK